MRASLALIAAAALFAASGAAQSMIEHAAAATGAIAGTAGGKALSFGIDKVLGRAADATSDAAATKPVAATSSRQPVNQPAAGNTSPAPFSTQKADNPAGQRRSRQRRQHPVFTSTDSKIGESQRIRMAQSYTLLPVPTPEDFAKIKDGSSRETVLSSLGTPWSHVTIPEEGHLIEIMSWYNWRQRVGTVRLDNGTVVSTSF